MTLGVATLDKLHSPAYVDQAFLCTFDLLKFGGEERFHEDWKETAQPSGPQEVQP